MSSTSKWPKPPFTADEMLPSTGNPVEDFGDDAIDRVAAAMATYSTIHVVNDRHRQMMAHLKHVVAVGQATKGLPQLAGRILGPSGSGKTTCARFFQKAYEARGLHGEGERPVVIVPLDRACTSRRLFSAILDELGDDYSDRGTEDLLKKRSYQALRRLGTRALLIDETQHLSYRSSERNDVTDTLKRVLDDSVCPLVFLGTDDAREMLNRNRQLGNRLHPPCDLPPLKRKEATDRGVFRAYVDDLDRALVEAGLARRPSGLAEKRRLSCLMAVTGGVLGRISNLVRAALAASIRRNAEMIELCDLSAATETWAVAQGFIAYNPFKLGVARERPGKGA